MSSKWFICIFLGVVDPVAPAKAVAQGEAEGIPASLAELRATLERTYPTRDAVQGAHRKITGRLRKYLETHPTAQDAGEAQALLAEVSLLGGDPASARAAWLAMIGAGPRDEDRARGLSLLATHDWMRGKRAEAGRRFRQLQTQFPKSPFAKSAERPLRFLALLDDPQRPVPAFEGRFEPGFEAVSADGPVGPRKWAREDLAKKVVFIFFWRSSTKDHQKFIHKFARDEKASLDQAIGKYPILEGEVEVLGVNLDLDKVAYRAAVEKWRVPWPQLHDGKGFETELAKTFGITRAPHWAVLAPAGGKFRIWYLGDNEQAFYQFASKALKTRRIALEKALEAEKKAAADAKKGPKKEE